LATEDKGSNNTVLTDSRLTTGVTGRPSYKTFELLAEVVYQVMSLADHKNVTNCFDAANNGRLLSVRKRSETRRIRLVK